MNQIKENYKHVDKYSSDLLKKATEMLQDIEMTIARGTDNQQGMGPMLFGEASRIGTVIEMLEIAQSKLREDAKTWNIWGGKSHTSRKTRRHRKTRKNRL